MNEFNKCGCGGRMDDRTSHVSNCIVINPYGKQQASPPATRHPLEVDPKPKPKAEIQIGGDIILPDVICSGGTVALRKRKPAK